MKAWVIADPLKVVGQPEAPMCAQSCRQLLGQPDLDIWVTVHAVDHCVVHVVGRFPPGGPDANAGIDLQMDGARGFSGAGCGQP